MYLAGRSNSPTDIATPGTHQPIHAGGMDGFLAKFHRDMPPITGPDVVCQGRTITLSNATTGGTWSSAGGVAGVTAATGIVTGLTAGTAIITYITPAGGTTAIVTVNAIPDTIAGSLRICVGDTVTLANSTPAGTWASSNVAVASIGVASGIAIGLTAGTTFITYMLATGCYVADTVTVVPPSICNLAAGSVADVPDLKLYPNPSNGVFEISLPEHLIDIHITITDGLGRTVKEIHGTDRQKQIRVALDVAPGIYFVRLYGASAGEVRKVWVK